MNLEEIVRRSKSDCYEYPDIFTDDCGLDIVWPARNLHTEAGWRYTRPVKKRSVVLQISSFVGIHPCAIHYYGILSVEGVKLSCGSPHLSGFTSDWDCEHKYPLSRSTYELRLTRPISKEEKDNDNQLGKNLSRFPYQQIGDLTPCWRTKEELIEFAKQVFHARFKGEWEMYCVDSTGITVPIRDYEL